MKHTIWLVLGLSLTGIPFKAMAGADLVIYYDNRPGITHHNVFGLDYVFFELDQLREQMQTSLAAEVRAQSSKISSQSVSIAEDLTFEVTGLTDQRVRLTATGFGSHLFFKFKCPLNIKKAKVDARISTAVVSTEYDLITGSTPYNVDLYGFNVRLRPGISVCSLATIYSFLFSVLGVDLDDLLIDLFEDKFRNEIENALTSTFSISGLGQSFLDLDPYVQSVPNHLFQQIGLTKNEVLDVLRNPFSGIRIKVKFDEDGVGYNGANDRLQIWIDVPWEDPPVATFTTTKLGGLDVRLDASGSHDPDGGPLTYHWTLNNGQLITRTTPILQHRFTNAGTQTVTLRVTDDEGVSNVDYQYISLCEQTGITQPFDLDCLLLSD